jgi:acyl-CoA oxidase
MPDFTDNLKPAADGTTILTKERSQSDVPEDELAKHLLSRNDFLGRQDRILRVLEKDALFNKSKQMNLSRPERYQLGLARAKKLRRLQDQYRWDEDDVAMSQYLCDDVSPFYVHYHMFVTTVREQGSDEQRAYWMPKIERMEAIGCYAQYVLHIALLLIDNLLMEQNGARSWE